MSRDIICSEEIERVISLVAIEAGLTDEEAVARIFAVAKVIYQKTSDNSIIVSDSKNNFRIGNIR